MPVLTVKNFSVIKDAEIELQRTNVIIGPQASGKSLLCRLAYFCAEVVSAAIMGLSDDMDLDSLRDQVLVDFISWFPFAELGKGKFEICYKSGKFQISLKRTSYRGRALDKLKLILSPEFCSAYELALNKIRASRGRSKSKRTDSAEYRNWTIIENARKGIRDLFSPGDVPSQTYIPAGRAFFTNYSKAITAFESGSLDVVTARFGRMIERIFNDNYFPVERDQKQLSAFDGMRRQILRGNLINKKGALSFVADDDRTLPLVHLSSGTQEAIPLLAALRWALITGRSRPVFAEEPEVHLFPSAQMELVKLFAWLANIDHSNSCWVITTHSPYILSVFNDLIKAGQVAKNQPTKAEEINKIIQKEYWINPGAFAAYAFDGKDGVLKSIMDAETGLIDGDILDDISAKIGRDFEELLEIQYES